MASQSIDTKTYILLLENEEYELNMTLFESVIEFKLIPKNLIIFTQKNLIYQQLIIENI